jgi:hypothetical protein
MPAKSEQHDRVLDYLFAHPEDLDNAKIGLQFGILACRVWGIRQKVKLMHERRFNGLARGIKKSGNQSLEKIRANIAAKHGPIEERTWNTPITLGKTPPKGCLRSRVVKGTNWICANIDPVKGAPLCEFCEAIKPRDEFDSTTGLFYGREKHRKDR